MSLARLVLAALLACATVVVAPAVAPADPPRYVDYYGIFQRGPAQIPLHDSRYVPQGLAYWPERDALAISYYDSRHGRSRLAIVTRSTGARRKVLTLRTTGHVGGLATSARYVWVANNGSITRYRKTAISRAANGATIRGSGTYTVPASSFMTIRGDKLWVGLFDDKDPGKAYRYSLDAAEVPRYDGVSFAIPSKVQGMAVTSRNFIWSRSYGRTNDSTLEIRPFSAPNGPAGRVIYAPTLSEGLAIAGSELHVLYESGSAVYPDATTRERTIHHGPLAKLGGP